MHDRYKRAKMADKAATVMFYAVAALFLILLAALTAWIIGRGIKSFLPQYIGFAMNGLGVQLFNTIYIVFLSLVISIPLGGAAGIYMAEYAKDNKLTRGIRISIETLSSLPSIVVGLFGFLVFVQMTKTTWNLLAGVLTLSVLSIPLLTRVTEDAIRAIPNTYREGSYAVGSTKWQTIVKVLLPTASPRIITGIILAAGRGFGEAAALIYTAGLTSDVNFHNWNPMSPSSPLNLFRPADTLAVRIWYLKSYAILDDKYAIADMAAALLIILVFVFNLGSRFVGRMLEKKHGLR